MAAVACEIGPEISAARRAAAWVMNFYSDIAVTLDREGAQLASSEHDEAALRLIWQTSLANEALLARGAKQRAGVIEALVQ